MTYEREKKEQVCGMRGQFVGENAEGTTKQQEVREMTRRRSKGKPSGGTVVLFKRHANDCAPFQSNYI